MSIAGGLQTIDYSCVSSMSNLLDHDFGAASVPTIVLHDCSPVASPFILVNYAANTALEGGVKLHLMF